MSLTLALARLLAPTLPTGSSLYLGIVSSTSTSRCVEARMRNARGAFVECVRCVNETDVLLYTIASGNMAIGELNVLK